MYCKFCGKPVDDKAKFCQHCGKNIESVNISENVSVGENKHESGAADAFGRKLETKKDNAPKKKEIVVHESEIYEDGFFFKGIKYRDKVLIAILGLAVTVGIAFISFQMFYPELWHGFLGII